MSVHQLRIIHSILAQHHSRDPGFLSQLQVEMANRGQCWRCPWCRLDCKMTSNNCSGCGTAWYPGVEVVQHRGQSPRHRQSPRRRQNQGQSGANDWTYAGGWDYAGYGGHQNGPWAGDGPPLPKMQSPRQKTSKSTAQSEAKKKTKSVSSARRPSSARASHVPEEEPDWDMDPYAHEDDKATPSTTATDPRRTSCSGL